MAKRLTLNQISEIKRLRTKGFSLPEISHHLKVGQGTVWRYALGVGILPRFRSVWLDKKRSSVKRMKDAEAKAEFKANNIIRDFSDKERLLTVAALYWAEGAKIDFNLTNTDPDLIKVFISGLRNVLKVTNDRLRLNVRIYQDMDEYKCVDFWLNVTGLSKKNISSVNVLVGKKTGKLKYGMCRLRVTKGGDMLKYMVAVRHKIIEKF